MGAFLYSLGLFIFIAMPRFTQPFQLFEVVGAILMGIGLVLMYPRR